MGSLEDTFTDEILEGIHQNFKDTIDWNYLAREQHPDIEVQADFVIEELKETYAGLATDNHVEILDGAGDVFFTAAYLEYLTGDLPITPVSIDKIIMESSYLLALLASRYPQEMIEEAITEVISSNYTKFVPVTNKIDVDREAMILTIREGEPITAQVVGDYVIFKNNKGKVRKPYTYREPDIKAIVQKYGY